MKKKIADGYASSSQASPPSNTNLSAPSTTQTIHSSVPPPPIANSIPSATVGTPAFEPSPKPITDTSNSEGPAYDGKGYGLARGTTNTYVIPGMDQMSPEEYRTKLQETISARQAKRREESLRSGRGTIGNRSSSGYLDQLGRQQQQQRQQGEKNELFDVKREKDSGSQLPDERLKMPERRSEPSKDDLVENQHGHVPNLQNSLSKLEVEVKSLVNQSPDTPQVKDVHNADKSQVRDVFPLAMNFDADSKAQTLLQQSQQAIPRPSESVRSKPESVNSVPIDVQPPTNQAKRDIQQDTQQQAVQPKTEFSNVVENLDNLQSRDGILPPKIEAHRDSQQTFQQQAMPLPNGSVQPKSESVNGFDNLANLRDGLPPAIQPDIGSQEQSQQHAESKPEGSVQPKAESVMDFASLLKKSRVERELSRKSEWQTKNSTHDKKKEPPHDEKAPSQKPLLKEETRWLIEKRQRPIPSSVPPTYAEVDEKFVGNASRQSFKSSGPKDSIEGGTWYDEKRMRPIPTAEPPQRPMVFDRTGPKLESLSKRSQKSLNASALQHGREKSTWYNEKRVRPRPTADAPRRPKVFDRTGTELESPLQTPTTNSSLLRSLLQSSAPNRRSQPTLQTFEKTVVSYTSTSSEINQWWKDSSHRPKNYVRHHTPMNNNYEDRPVHPKNYGDLKLILTEWDIVESDAASDDDGGLDGNDENNAKKT
eukprot:CCRYP_000046-RB/>CCRYP_000046-RB protein AED:0.09 eAED:0.09 QI:489/1/1/1/0.5/0.66/3/761/705